MSFTYKEDVFKGVMDFRFIYADGPFTSGTAKEFVSFVESKHMSLLQNPSNAANSLVRGGGAAGAQAGAGLSWVTRRS